MKINLDFDGTCVSHAFPKVGEDIGAVPVLKELVANGHKLILFTMRSNNKEGPHKTILTDAIKWFEKNEIPLYGVQTDPEQHKWTKSPKSYAHLMIDDSALGCPLIFDKAISHRPFVDWVVIRELLIINKYLK
tara:strand:+ start:202 stop:600 length:399 start_codon:yes stop_codon:yes gene_type:complete